MPIIDRKTADEVGIYPCPEPSIKRGLTYLALIGVDPFLLLLNIWAYERRWQKTYVPQYVIDRANALKTSHRETIEKIIKAKQWPGTFWFLVASNFILIMFLLGIFAMIDLLKRLKDKFNG